jgi:nucleolar MIF4G domain-containing protein 1
MKPKVRIFLEILLVTVLLNADPKYQGLGRSQRHISDIFGTLSETPEVIRGLQRFIKAVIKRTEVVDEDEKESIKRNCKTASTILKDLTNALSPEH